MQIVNFLPTKNAEIHKVSKLYEVRLFNFNQYEESFYCLTKYKNCLNVLDVILYNYGIIY